MLARCGTSPSTAGEPATGRTGNGPAARQVPYSAATVCYLNVRAEVMLTTTPNYWEPESGAPAETAAGNPKTVARRVGRVEAAQVPAARVRQL
jgi:hypothetical protein